MAEQTDVHKVFAEYFKGCEALAYAVSSRLGEGNMCLDIEEYLKTEDIPSLNSFYKDAADFRDQIQEGTHVTHDLEGLKPFIIHNGKAYLHRYFRYETEIIENIRRLNKNFHIVTGGPGSGKTFSVSVTLDKLFQGNPGLKVSLAAPTGKAAVRINESIKKYAGDPKNNVREEIKKLLTGLTAQTIHRLLVSKPDSVFFKYNEKNRLPFDVVIIDECSMVDGAMMAKLLNAISDKTILYLIGDKNQLASVEAGSVFGDLCRAGDCRLLEGKVKVIEGSRRFQMDKGIGKFSKEIIDGDLKDINSYSGDEQIRIEILRSEDPKTDLFREKVLKSEFFRKYALEYKAYIKEDDIKNALKLLNKVRFLCVTRENDYSVAETNKKIEKILKEEGDIKDRFFPKEGFYHNQPVIITQNDYKLGIFNGDVGIIRKKKTKDGEALFAHFETTDGKIKEIQAGYLNHYETVFAMTIHKSQGSEFDYVVVILPEKQGEKLLTRELLYTGVTRAMSKAHILSTQEVLLKCAQRSVTRASGIEDRMNHEKQ